MPALGRTLGLTLAVLMIAAGTLFALQGLGYVEGSSMTGSHTWAVLGPIIAGLGVALAITVVGSGRGSGPSGS